MPVRRRQPLCFVPVGKELDLGYMRKRSVTVGGYKMDIESGSSSGKYLRASRAEYAVRNEEALPSESMIAADDNIELATIDPVSRAVDVEDVSSVDLIDSRQRRLSESMNVNHDENDTELVRADAVHSDAGSRADILVPTDAYYALRKSSVVEGDQIDISHYEDPNGSVKLPEPVARDRDLANMKPYALPHPEIYQLLSQSVKRKHGSVVPWKTVFTHPVTLSIFLSNWTSVRKMALH